MKRFFAILAVLLIGAAVAIPTELGTRFAMFPDSYAVCYYPDSVFHGVSIGDTFTFDNDTTWSDTTYFTSILGIHKDTLIVGEDTLKYPGEDSTVVDTLVPYVLSVQSWPDFIITSANVKVQYIDTTRLYSVDTVYSEPFLMTGLSFGSDDTLYSWFPVMLQAISTGDSDSVAVLGALQFSTWPNCQIHNGDMSTDEAGTYSYTWGGNDTTFIDTVLDYVINPEEWFTIIGMPRCARLALWGSSDSTNAETGTVVRVVIPGE